MTRLLPLALFIWAAPALAQAAPGAAPDPLKGLLLNMPVFIGIFALFYFGMIRPQRQQQKQHGNFVSGLKRGDEIITSAGIIGTIRGLTERVISLEISEGTEIKILRSQAQGYFKEAAATAK